MSASSPPNLMISEHGQREAERNVLLIDSCNVCCGCTVRQLCITYRSTLSMASGSGGGIWKQTPGNVFVEPSAETMSHFSMSELDFRVNFSALDRESYMIMMNKRYVERFR